MNLLMMMMMMTILVGMRGCGDGW